MIHESDGTFTISSHGMWLPGIYASKRAARYAFRFSSLALNELQDRINHSDRGNRVITMDDLRELRRA